MKKLFNILNKKNLYNGFFQLYEYTIQHKKHDNTWSGPLVREIFGGATVATVLPYDPQERKIILIDQFRPGIIENSSNPIMKEIVAGFIDKGETPKEAALRECEEEIGCKVNKIKKIYSYYPAPGSSQSYYHFFLAEVKSFKGIKILGKKDEDEDILARCYTINEIKKLMNEGQINNGLTLMALQWFFLNDKKNI